MSPAPQIHRSLPPSHQVDAVQQATLGSRDEVGIEGVCRYDETSVECWDVQGKPASSLSAIVRSAVHGMGGGQPLSVIPGKKIRLAVARLPHDPPDGVTVSNVELNPDVAVTPIYFPLAGAADGRRRIVVYVVPDTNSEVGSVRFVSRKRLPKEATIPLKKGATVRLGSSTLTVSEVSKLGPEDEERFFVKNRPAWRVVVTKSGSPKTNEAFFPVDPYPLHLPDGRRASMDSLNRGKMIFAPNNATEIRLIMYSELPDGAVAVLLDKDPAKVKTLKIGGHIVRRTVVTGIPLEPR